MRPNRAEIEALVMRIQEEFLRAPGVRLTLNEIARQMNASISLCKAVVRVLVDARVLAQTPGGGYQRFVPLAAAAPRPSRGRAA
jgi:hypothetical protein